MPKSLPFKMSFAGKWGGLVVNSPGPSLEIGIVRTRGAGYLLAGSTLPQLVTGNGARCRSVV